MDKNSIFWVYKSQERKNRGIQLALTSHGMVCDPGVANHKLNVLFCWGYVRAQVDEAADITSRTMNACVVRKILSM